MIMSEAATEAGPDPAHVASHLTRADMPSASCVHIAPIARVAGVAVLSEVIAIAPEGTADSPAHGVSPNVASPHLKDESRQFPTMAVAESPSQSSPDPNILLGRKVRLRQAMVEGAAQAVETCVQKLSETGDPAGAGDEQIVRHHFMQAFREQHKDLIQNNKQLKDFVQEVLQTFRRQRAMRQCNV